MNGPCTVCEPFLVNLSETTGPSVETSKWGIKALPQANGGRCSDVTDTPT